MTASAEHTQDESHQTYLKKHGIEVYHTDSCYYATLLILIKDRGN
jgi:hypothetical protein